MTPQEARERWPVKDYPSDTLGGMRRDIAVRAYALAGELRAKTKGTAAETLAGQVAEGFLAEMARMESELDRMVGA